MSGVAAKVWRYSAGMTRALRRWRPAALLATLGGTPWVVKRLDRYGFEILLDRRDPAVSRPLLLSGDYEPHVAAALTAVLRADSRLLDLGANIGFFSLLAAVRCPRGRVFSLEPDPGNFRLLAASIALNGLADRITAWPYAASDAAGVAVLSDLGNPRNLGARFVSRSRAVLQARVHGPQPSFREIRTVRLDDLLAAESVDVIKVDVEGHEPLALRGAEGLLQRCRPVILMEFSPGNIINIAQTRPEDLLIFLRGLGYRWQVISDDGRLGTPGDDPAALLRAVEGSGCHHADLLLAPDQAGPGWKPTGSGY